VKYKIINGWTKQSMIEAIKKYTPTEGKAVHPSGVCVYLDADGKSCAVGAFLRTFLPVEHEAFTVYGSVANPDTHEPLFPEFMSRMPLDLDGLQRIQREHDEHTGRHRTTQEHLVSWIQENCEE
jgi:hypothetical protein